MNRKNLNNICQNISCTQIAKTRIQLSRGKSKFEKKDIRINLLYKVHIRNIYEFVKLEKEIRQKRGSC